MKIHIVQKGDTLWKIAKKYGVNFEELKQMNTQLSNPDMIMPGMKIKVPTTGGTIKKEAPLGSMPAKINLGSKKEMPIVQQPIVKEQPKVLPIKEAPIQMPIKEAPIQMPVKEAPIAPYVPKMPIMPEIDINNYYMMNMANMSIQQPAAPQLPPKPVNILPEVKEEPKAESPVSPEPVVQQPIQGGLEQPMYPQYCYPISPVLPGSGLPCPPVPCPPLPCPPGYPMASFPQVQGAMMPQQMPYQPSVLGVTDESSSFVPPLPTQTAPVAEAQMPMYPAYPQQAPMMQMPYGHVPYCGPLYPISPVLPGTGLPAGQIPYGFPQLPGYPQVQGVMDVESPEMVGPQYQMPQMLPTQQMAPPPVAGTGDCGCGGPKHHGAPMSQGFPYPQVAPMPQGVPYPQVAPMSQGFPYPQTAPMPQGVPYSQAAPMPQGFPYPQADQFPQGAPTQQGAPFQQGTPYPTGVAPSLQPGFGQGMTPYYNQPPQGQPPVMNPYGVDPMGGAFSMPRYHAESSEYEG